MLDYHLILVVKYRREVIDSTISERLKEIFEYISPRYKITLEEWHQTRTTFMYFLGAQPHSEISKFLNAYKSASSRLIKKEFPQIRKKSMERVFWSELLPVNYWWCSH